MFYMIAFVVASLALGGQALMEAWGILSWLTAAAWVAGMAWLVRDIWGARIMEFYRDVRQDLVDVLEEGTPPEEQFRGDFPATLPDSSAQDIHRASRGGR